MEAGFRPHDETIDQLVAGDLHRLRRETIHRVRLITRPRHQRHERHVHALSALALEDVGVERIERVERLVESANGRDQRKQPALRRGCVHIVEMREVGRIFKVAEHRDAVNFGSAPSAAAAERNRVAAQRAGAKAKHVPARERRHSHDFLQERLPIFAALSASHHHRLGKPDMPYFGSGSGWLKRSQRA